MADFAIYAVIQVEPRPSEARNKRIAQRPWAVAASGRVVLHGLLTLSLLLEWVPHMPALDQSLAERVDQAIQTNPYISRRTLRFETDGSRIVLHGCVPSYFQKQMAQEAVRRVDGVEQIENCLEVMWA